MRKVDSSIDNRKEKGLETHVNSNDDITANACHGHAPFTVLPLNWFTAVYCCLLGIWCYLPA